MKLSEAILSILGDKFICSTLLARLMEEFPASKMRLQPRGGHLGIFWVGMCRPGLQIAPRSIKNFP